MIDAIGWLGALLLATCALPQTYKCCVDRNADGLSWGFIGMWLGGELLTLTYVAAATPSIILIVNYTVNIACLAVIVSIKLGANAE